MFDLRLICVLFLEAVIVATLAIKLHVWRAKMKATFGTEKTRLREEMDEPWHIRLIGGRTFVDAAGLIASLKAAQLMMETGHKP